MIRFGTMDNFNVEKQLPYGVIQGNSVPELLDDIEINGTDLTFEAAREELKQQLQTAVKSANDKFQSFREKTASKFFKALNAELKTVFNDFFNKDRLIGAIDKHEVYTILQDGKQPDFDAMREEVESAGFWDGMDNGEGHNYRHEWEVDLPNGTKGKVQVEVTQLGGAPLIYVIDSPYYALCARCSPCCPNAGDLDTPREQGNAALCLPPDDMPEDWEGKVLLFGVDE